MDDFAATKETASWNHIKALDKDDSTSECAQDSLCNKPLLLQTREECVHTASEPQCCLGDCHFRHRRKIANNPLS